ncbi:MAG: twin-arginine translocase subunit TatC [Rubrobacteraceae bacterium]
MASRLRLPLRSDDEARMTLIDHLDELRSRIIKIGAAFIVAAIVAWIFHVRIYEALLEPSGLKELQFTSLTAPFLTDVKLTLYSALVLTVPVLLYQAWAFVAPAVGEVGKLFTYTLIVLASSLFLAGIAFAYYLVLPLATEFLLSWGEERFEEIITADNYLAFVTRFLFAFGIGFEMPAATFVGAKLGLVSGEMLRKFRRAAIVVNAVLAAALTPADVLSMILLAIPLIFLYEVSILIALYVNPVTEGTGADALVDDEEEDYDDEDSENGDRS